MSPRDEVSDEAFKALKLQVTNLERAMFGDTPEKNGGFSGRLARIDWKLNVLIIVITIAGALFSPAVRQALAVIPK